jgi:hypothetical protein
MKSVYVQQFSHPKTNLFTSGQGERLVVGLAQNTSLMLKDCGSVWL